MAKINEYFPISSSPPFSYIASGNPTTDVNPPIKHILWLNTNTGEIFVCIDNTPNNNIWIGQKGTIIKSGNVQSVELTNEDNTNNIENVVNDNEKIDLIAFYDFNDNVNDKIGNFHGIWYGNEQYVNDNNYGKVAKFDGKSYVIINTPNFNCNTLSISLWFKVTEEYKGTRCVFLFSINGNNHFGLYLTAKRYIRFYVNNKGKSFYKFELNKWYNVIYSSDGSIYVNGNFIDKYFPINVSKCTCNFIIGGDRDSSCEKKPNQLYIGLLDDLCIISDVITFEKAKKIFEKKMF